MKTIEENDKLQLLLLASQYQNLTMQLQLLQRDLLTAQQEIAKKGEELQAFRRFIAEKYEVDLTKETLDPKTGEFIPMPSNLPFQVQRGE
jgi:flagellar biosynthesis chaperone FliJ